MAAHAMQYTASPAVIEGLGYGAAGLLLADREVRTEPAHFTVIGEKDSSAAMALFHAVITDAPGYARIEWLDRREGPLVRADVEYPDLPYPAAFVCASGTCSKPLRTVEEIAQRMVGPRRVPAKP